MYTDIYKRKVLSGQVASKFSIWSQAVTFVWVQLRQVANAVGLCQRDTDC